MVLSDSKHIITITPDYVAFNYRGCGCYRVNSGKGSEKDIILHGYNLLSEYFAYFSDSPDVSRAIREVDEQISWIGQGELF